MGDKVKSEDYLSVKELGKYAILERLSKKERKQLANLLLVRNYKEGELVYRINYPHTVLYFVAKGEINIFLEEDGEDLQLVNKGKYEHFGEIGLFLEISRTASARAIEESVLLAMTKKDFEDFIKLNPKAATKILQSIGSMLCQIIINNNKRLRELQPSVSEEDEKKES